MVKLCHNLYAPKCETILGVEVAKLVRVRSYNWWGWIKNSHALRSITIHYHAAAVIGPHLYCFKYRHKCEADLSVDFALPLFCSEFLSVLR